MYSAKSLIPNIYCYAWQLDIISASQKVSNIPWNTLKTSYKPIYRTKESIPGMEGTISTWEQQFKMHCRHIWHFNMLLCGYKRIMIWHMMDKHEDVSHSYLFHHFRFYKKMQPTHPKVFSFLHLEQTTHLSYSRLIGPW